jgi:benzylsuccinate CoA-transferase BbsF subunit
VSHNGFGSTGPYAHFKSWGPIVQAYAGLTSLSRLPEMEPAGWCYSYMDHLGAWYMSIAILAALHHRARTGEGQAVDLAGTEAGANLLGPYFLDCTVNDRSLTREPTWSSNRSISPSMAPHGIFPTALDDRWVSLAVRSDAEWHRLTGAIDEPWCDDERYRTVEGRLSANEELEAQIGAWSSRQQPDEVSSALRDVRVAVAVVASPEERIDLDEATSAFGLWPEAVHSELGRLRVEGLPFHLSGGDWEITRGAPCLGEHNDLVIGDLLGHSAKEIEAWREAGVL